MKRIFTLLIGVVLFLSPVYAQRRVVDATDHSPIPTATIFDASGNVVGFTSYEGSFSEIPESAYPLTLTSIGYEPLVIDSAEDKTWEMKPKTYLLEEVVVKPGKRNVLKQTFYIREYFSMSNATDTATFFIEHMADRFVPTSKDAKFSGSSDMRILDSHHYARYQLFGEDSISTNPEDQFISMATIFKPLDEEIPVPESFKEPGNAIKHSEKSGKSGTVLILKQNAQTLTMTVDVLADKKNHKMSPWLFKLLGFTMNFNQIYTTHAYQVNDTGVYQPKDLIQACYVMEAEGRGKFLRMALKSKEPVQIHYTIELYIVDRNYLTKERAKEDYKNKPTDVKFVVPSTVPPLNEATQRLVDRANAEAKNKK